jgi:hypothetical protein
MKKKYHVKSFVAWLRINQFLNMSPAMRSSLKEIIMFKGIVKIVKIRFDESYFKNEMNGLSGI